MEATKCNTTVNGINMQSLMIKDLKHEDDMDLISEEEWNCNTSVKTATCQ